MKFAEKLRAAQKKMNSWLCVGLDPDLTKIPEFIVNKHGQSLPEHFGPVEVFCMEIVKATAEYACAFKPNIAFFEALGQHGRIALNRVIQFIKINYPDHVVILDAKRNDIGNTANQYALAYTMIEDETPDAITVNPYLGPKTLEPFLKQGLGIIALCVTSNPDAAIFQNQILTLPDGQQMELYKYVALILSQQSSESELWHDQLGLVTGATHPEELGAIRKIIGNDIPLLIPGIGKQGGDLEATMKNNGGGLAVINSSSGIIFASRDKDYTEAAGQAAKKQNDQINKIRESMKG